MRLSEIHKSGKFRIVDVDHENEAVRRLALLGLQAGIEVRLLHQAPLGDPIAIEFHGCSMGVRLVDAAYIRVEEVK